MGRYDAERKALGANSSSASLVPTNSNSRYASERQNLYTPQSQQINQQPTTTNQQSTLPKVIPIPMATPRTVVSIGPERTALEKSELFKNKYSNSNVSKQMGTLQNPFKDGNLLDKPKPIEPKILYQIRDDIGSAGKVGVLKEKPEPVVVVGENKSNFYVDDGAGNIKALKKEYFRDYAVSQDEMLKEAASDQEKQNKKSGIQKFGERTIQSLQSAAGMEVTNKTTTGNKAADVVSDIAGGILSFGQPGFASGSSLGGTSNQIGKNIIGTMERKGLNTGNRVADKVIKGGVEGAATMVPVSVHQSANENLNTQQTVKKLGEDVGIGLLFGSGLGAAGAGIGKLMTYLKKPVQELNSITEPIVIQKIKRVQPNSPQGKYTFKNAGYDKAVNEYNAAIEEIHNYFKTNELRANEIPLIKSELGIDLDTLINNMAKYEGKTGSQIIKDVAQNSKLKRASGLGSDRSYKVMERVAEQPDNLGVIQRRMFGDDFIRRNMSPTGKVPTKEIKVNRPVKQNTPVTGFEQGKSRFAQQVKYNSTLPPEYKKVSVIPDYEIIKDKDAWTYAKNKIDTDAESAARELLNKPQAVGKNDVATGIALMEKYAAEGKFDIVNDVVKKVSLDLTNAGQTVQAGNLLAKNTPAGMVKYAQSEIKKGIEKIATAKEKELLKTIDELNEKITQLQTKKQSLQSKGRTPNILKQINDLDDMLRVNLQLFGETKAKLPAKFKNAQLTAEDSAYIFNKQKEIQSMTPGAKKTEEVAKLQAWIGRKIPVSLGQKISTAQTLAQLLNTKTLVRNLGGNAGFAATENISDVIGSQVYDRLISLITKQRTKTMPSLTAQGKGFAKGFKAGVSDAVKGIDTSGFKTQYDLPRQTFKNPVGRVLETALNIELKATDRAFYQAAFNNSIKNQMKLKGLKNVADVTDDMIQEAHLDGLYKTFQDENVLSKAFTKLKKVLNGGKAFGFGDLVLKYPKTPANLLMRAIDYSPAGIVKAAFQLRNGLKANQKNIVESLSRATVGTGLMGLSVMMYRSGIITGKRPKDKEASELLRETGQGQYNFNKDAFIRWISTGFDPEAAKAQPGDKTLNYDWLQPQALSIAGGANVAQQLKEKNKANPLDVIGAVAYSLESGVDTLAEQPLVQGVARMFQYGNISENLTNTLASTPSSFMPTFVNQVRQMTDNKSRNVESQKTDIVGKTLDKSLNLILNKVPVISKSLPEKITTTGNVRELYQNGSNDWYNVLFNPAFVSTFKPTPGTNLVLDLYNKTGETKQFPRLAPKSITINSKKLNLTQEQQNDLQKVIGQKTIELLDKYSKDLSVYSDEEKIKAIGRILDSVGDYGKGYLFNKLGKDYIEKNLK